MGFLGFVIGYFAYYHYVLADKSNMDKIKQTLMAGYLFLVACVTILPIDFTLHLKGEDVIQPVYIHLIPFEDLILRHGGARREIVLNILMTIPFGFLVTWIKKEMTWMKVIWTTALLSLTIEGIQLMMTIFLLHHRSCDITDILTNTIGGVLGYLLFKVCIKENRKRKTAQG